MVKRGEYGVKLVRGPFVRLAPHPDACETKADLLDLAARYRTSDPSIRLAADLFSGAGGLSLGLDKSGFRTVVAVDHYREAIETHNHHFPGMSLNWDLSDPNRIEELADILKSAAVDLIAGGPPCQPFSKAGRSGIRHLVRNGLREPHDQRRDLWRAYLEVVRLVMPAAVIMENVPDMALDREMFILRSVIEELEQLGYAVEERVIETWRYGVPQFRQRLILVAMRDGKAFDWPAESSQRVSVWNAIGDMPEVEGGWRPDAGAEGWADYSGPVTQFQQLMRADVSATDSGRLFDHITRPVREDDARAFEVMDSKTRYSELPAEFKRYRDDIFNDKYKRLDEDDLSRTITAHIAKDGYWYIHPRQGRTITVREAARIQTFPDWFRFSGPPSAAFKQIGNAVPPLLGQRLGESLLLALQRPRAAPPSSRQLAADLSAWSAGNPESDDLPWLSGANRWQIVCADILLDRATTETIRFIWPLVSQWLDPASTLLKEATVLEVGSWIGRERKAQDIIELARRIAVNPTVLDDAEHAASTPFSVPQSTADFAALVVPVAGDEASEEPVLVTKGVLRVAARYFGVAVDRRNRLTDGRLAVARMIGGGLHARAAHVALIRLAASICRVDEAHCDRCPIAASCLSSRAEERQSTRLF